MTIFLGVGTLAGAFQPAPYSSPTLATVKVSIPDGHGSGVVLKNGTVLTARHVVVDEATGEVRKDITVQDEGGKSVEATVIWEDKNYDVALLKPYFNSYTLKHRAELECSNDHYTIGESIEAVGNPINLDFVHSFGRLSGKSRAFVKMGWNRVLIADITIAPGSSGGPAFDVKTGKVIGITNGVSVSPLGFGASLVPFAMIVPSSTICGLIHLHELDPAAS